MKPETDLEQLLANVQPKLVEGEYVFCTVRGTLGDYLDLDPIGTVREEEGLTLIIERERAEAAKLRHSAPFRCITLSAHSSLEAVGFLAAMATRLARHGIAVNPLAGYHHDHLLVPADRADEALRLLARTAADPT